MARARSVPKLSRVRLAEIGRILMGLRASTTRTTQTENDHCHLSFLCADGRRLDPTGPAILWLSHRPSSCSHHPTDRPPRPPALTVSAPKAQRSREWSLRLQNSGLLSVRARRGSAHIARDPVHGFCDSSQSSTNKPAIDPSFNAASFVTNVASCSSAVQAMIKSKSLFLRPRRSTSARTLA